MSHLILVDGNNWGFAGLGSPKLSAGQKDTQAIFYIIRKLRNTFMDHPKSLICVLWDGKSWRHSVYPEYKANRGKTDKDKSDRSAYYEQSPEIKNALDYLGIMQVTCPNMEADDLAAIMSKRWYDKFSGNKVTLLTADKDWQQLVNDRVTWVDLIHDKRCDFRTFQKVTGFETIDQFIEAKCILGDVGDNIIGVHGIGDKTLDRIYALYPNFRSFLRVSPEQRTFAWIAGFGGKQLPKVLREIDEEAVKEKIAFNELLVNLRHGNIPKPEKIISVANPLDKDKFVELCYRNSFLSITKDINKFLQPFKDNEYVTWQVSQSPQS